MKLISKLFFWLSELFLLFLNLVASDFPEVLFRLLNVLLSLLDNMTLIGRSDSLFSEGDFSKEFHKFIVNVIGLFPFFEDDDALFFIQGETNDSFLVAFQ